MIDISEIETRLKRAQAKAEKARIALESASTDVARLEIALSVVRELIGAVTPVSVSESGLTERQQFVVESLKFGQNNSMSPVEVYQVASQKCGFSGDVNYVRTTLWRMADKGQVGSAKGAYWRFTEEVAATTVGAESPSQVSEWGGNPSAANANMRPSPESEDWERSHSDAQSSPWDDDSEIPF